MSDRRSAAPPFKIGTTTWLCWIVDEQRYEWRSTCGRMFAGMYQTMCWSRVGDQAVGSSFKSLREAMFAAQQKAGSA